MLEEAAAVLKGGGVILFPTDTVWGVGAAANSKIGVERLYEIKKREQKKPTAVLIADMIQAEALGIFSEPARQLAGKHWPGALTLVVQAKKGGTVGLRMPDFDLVRQLCGYLGGGIMTASANFAGGQAPRKREEIDQQLEQMVDLVLEGECGGALPSTVVDVTLEPIKIIRQGGVIV